MTATKGFVVPAGGGKHLAVDSGRRRRLRLGSYSAAGFAKGERKTESDQLRL
jgi:hypothetical protein